MPVQTDSAAGVAVHIATQPIVGQDGQAVGYELLFRASARAGSAQVFDGGAATAQVLTATFLDFGVRQLVGDGLAFVNLPRPFLVGDLPLPFDPGQVVLEVLEDVPADPQVLAGVERLVRQGHRVALDDVTARRSRTELLHLAHYVKIDLLDTDPAELPALVRRCQGGGRQLIAEKVETAEQLELCQALGVQLFQGYFTGRPHTRTQRALSPSRLSCLRLLVLLSDPDVHTPQVVTALQAEPGLTVKVLQAASSAAAGLAHRPASVQDAVVHVGLRRLQAWVTLLGLGAAGSTEPLKSALRRASMCQSLITAPTLESAAFLTGLLSGLAQALDVPHADLLSQVPVATPVEQALLHQHGPLGQVLSAVLAYETGQHPAPAPVGLTAPATGTAPASSNSPATAAQVRAAYLSAHTWSLSQAASAAA